jgi:UDP-N-acetylglucosamine acyltransferase
MPKIHKTAVIHPKAEINDSVEIGPYTVIDGPARIGAGTRILGQVHIQGRADIGEHNLIFPFCTFGHPPQDINDKGEDCGLEIGSHNTFRAHVDINRGSNKGSGLTKIGNGNFFMAHSHVGHDSELGDKITFTNAVAAGGHSQIEDYAYLSFASAVHQFTRVGGYSIIGGGCMITQDVPPFAMVIGSRPTVIVNINIVGLRRNGFSRREISDIKQAYKILFWSGMNTSQALKQIEESMEITKHIAHLINFIKTTERGIIKKTGEKRSQ